MAASVTLNVQLNEAQAKAGLQAIADAIKPLTTPIKLDVNTKGAVSSLKDLNTIASNLEKKLSKGFGNEYDASIRKSEAASKAFSAALRQQMQAEQEYEASHKGMISSMNVIDQAIHEREVASKAFSEQLRQQMQAEQEEAAAAKKAGQAAKEAGAAAKQGGQDAAQSGQDAARGASGWSVLSGAMATFIGTMASRALQAGFRAITRGIREAIDEMKNVDTQLTNISKVSGKTGADLAAIGDKAYDTASKYGVAASTYLESVYNMQKAGMGDQSEAMGELAIKTMLVGDTTETVASKFLIAANAAWKLDGNMQQLGKIVDEADYINNNYATSLDKLATSMPIVANVAAQAGMSAEETMAALGTIQAVTQESGTKSATALRALILNIEKEVGKYVTEEGEEFEVTAESVKTMQGLLEKYAKTEMDAAKAAGELINPMTAIEALFKGMANADLSDADLFNLLTAMGGKLRTNQLTALVQNFGMFEEILEGLGHSAGTADKEISLMMESWERKTQVLKNKWTELINDTLGTETMKSAVDMLTEIVDGLDTLVNKGKNPLYKSDSTNAEIQSTEDKIKDLQAALEELQKSKKPDNQAIRDLEVELELQQKILDTKKEQYKLERDEEAKKLQNQLTSSLQNQFLADPNDPNSLIFTNDQLYDYTFGKALSGVDFAGSLTDYQAALRGLVSTYGEYYDNLIKVRDADIALTDSQQHFLDAYEDVKQASEATALHTGELVDGYYEIVDAEGNVLLYAKDISEDLAKQQEQSRRNLEGSQEVIDDLIQKTKDLYDAEDEYSDAEGTQERAEALDRLLEARKAYNDALENATQAERDAAADAISDTDQIGGQVDAVKSAMGNLVTAIQSAASATGEVQTGADSISFANAISSANALTSALQGAAAAASSISVGGIGGISGHAKGTKNAPGGPTLVNELGPELISENGHAYIANGGMPGIVNLTHGAIVLTADETKRALSGKNAIPGIMHAAAGGKAATATGGGSGPNVTSKSNGSLAAATAGAIMAAALSSGLTVTGDKGTKSTSGLNGGFTVTSGKQKRSSGGGGNVGGGGAAAAEKSIEELAKESKDILSNLEKQAKLADNRKQYSKETDLYTQAQKEIDKMVASYKKAGYKETDDEILDLLNKRYDYEKKKETSSKKAIKEAADELKDKLSNLDKQAKLAASEGDYAKEVQFYEQSQEAIKKMVERYRKAGYKDDSTEIVELLQKNVDYGEKQVKVYQDRWKDLIDALEEDTEAQEVANRLAEKEQALAEAQESLANATKQRTVRIYNAQTGQWEWVTDQSKVKSAQESLTKAEKDYADEIKDQAVSELEKLSKTVTDLNNVVLGPALSAIMLKAESSEEFQNFARALNAVYGVGSYLSSTEGSTKVLSTNDSHDTIYTFGDITLTEEAASSMSVAQLAQKLQVLKIS